MHLLTELSDFTFSQRVNLTCRLKKKDDFEKQIAGRWHAITLHEASEYVDHDILTAILFNKDTFYTKIDVNSIYLHDTRRDLPDRVMEGEQGWVLQGVLSRASFRRSPVGGQKSFAVLSLHISNIYAEKTRYCQEAHPHHPCHHDSMAVQQQGKTSALSTKPVQTVHCQRR